ncbi:hypothetical protein V8C42DRAFT_304613 [Trichoderma barbatum]
MAEPPARNKTHLKGQPCEINLLTGTAGAMSRSSSIPLQPEVDGLGVGSSSTMKGYNSNPELGSKPASYSCEKRAMALEETSHPLSSHLPSKLSRRRARSQIANPVVDFDVAIAEKPYNPLQSSQPEEEPKSYYIINPRVPGLAWYLTKGRSNLNAHEYEIERIPTHLVHVRQNRIGYLFETATRDDVTRVAGGRPVSWTPKCQNGWSSAAMSFIEKAENDTEVEPGKRVNRFERYDSDGHIKTQLHNESNIIVEHRDIPHITESIIRQFHIAGLKQNRTCMTKGRIESDEALSSEDRRELEHVIEATLMRFRRSVQCSDDAPETDEEDASPQSKLPAQFALEDENQRMKPRPSVVADPAITLSTPHTSFTVADSNHKRNEAREQWQRDAPTLTTLVSPQSVSSITWTKHGGYLGEPSLSPDSTNSPSDENSERTSSHCVQKQDQELETSQASIGSSSMASTITSFPKLLSRHCTREWIKPLASLEDTSTDPSYPGVEAHTNRLPHHQTASIETPVTMCWPDDSFQSSNTSSYFTKDAPNTRRTTVSQSPSTDMKSFGAQIGSAAHRRRSAPTYDPKEPPSRDHFFPNILSNFFASKKRESQEDHDSKERANSGTLVRCSSPAHDHIPVSTPTSGNGSFTERTSTVPVEVTE